MITNEKELKATQARIVHFHHWFLAIRKTAHPEEFDAVASGYRLEIEQMQGEVLEYLLRPMLPQHDSQTPPSVRRHS